MRTDLEELCRALAERPEYQWTDDKASAFDVDADALLTPVVAAWEAMHDAAHDSPR